MNHVTSVGLDVHARSVTGAALNALTGEVVTTTFPHEPLQIAEWILSFQHPVKAVYESGPTGFTLQRALTNLGVDCTIGAVSKMFRPSADRKRKNDRNDAIFLARMLNANNIVAVWIPDEECEAARNLFRAYEDARDELSRAKQRLSKFLLRHGYVYNEYTASGTRKNAWTQAYWVWLRSLKFSQEADVQTFLYYTENIKARSAEKQVLLDLITSASNAARWKPRVDALRCLKGIDTIGAFALVVEVDCFSRFNRAEGFSAWLGLVPRENSSGETRRNGAITKAGNSHLRRLLVEASWTYSWASASSKQLDTHQVVALPVQRRARAGIQRLVKRRQALAENGKKSTVVNTAIARELSCWIWEIGCSVEAT